jgi:hypothetical protein
VNKIQQFAADLKARKGVGKRTPRNVPAHAPPTGACVLRGSSTIERLKVELRSARERADKAETALAAVHHVEKVNAQVWRLNQQIVRLRAAAAKRGDAPQRECKATVARTYRSHFAAMRKLWKQIAALELENERLRHHAKGDRDSHAEQRT